MENHGSDEYYMRMAIQQAVLAEKAGDVPVGAIIVHSGSVIARAHNQVELLKDPTAHAEMIAITQAAAKLGDWRLLRSVLYVTKEPCAMCSGAIALARIKKVVFGTRDPEQGGHLKASEVVTGVLDEECRAILQTFFQALREKNSGSTAAPDL